VSDPAPDLAAQARASQQRAALAAATYQALKQRRRLKSHRIITYRCPDRCLLLDVLNLPQGVVFHQPAYKLPPAVNAAASSTRGREKHTRDGDRRWQSWTYFAEDCTNVSTNCVHVHQVVLDKAEVKADLDAGHAEMVVDGAGERRPG